MKLLVNAPTGLQELIEIGEGGNYFDPTRVLWDERADGELPPITLGGMARSGNALVFSQAVMNATAAVRAPIDAEAQRKAAIETAIANDTTIASLKAMSNADFDTWWAANVTNLAQALGLLKRLTRVVIRRVL